jgi:calcineurin-like phosphoesterase
MHKIERTSYGIRVTVSGNYSHNETSSYITEKEKIIAEINGPFSILADAREAIPPTRDDRVLYEMSHLRMKEQQLLRMAVMLTSPVLTQMAKQMMFKAGLQDRARIIDHDDRATAERLALQWILDGTEPDNATGTRDRQRATE